MKKKGRAKKNIDLKWRRLESLIWKKKGLYNLYREFKENADYFADDFFEHFMKLQGITEQFREKGEKIYQEIRKIFSILKDAKGKEIMHSEFKLQSEMRLEDDSPL